MRSDRDIRPRASLGLKLRGRPARCSSSTCRSLFIVLYAFTTEDRSYQFPPPGLTLKWFARRLGPAGHLRRARPVGRGRRASRRSSR